MEEYKKQFIEFMVDCQVLKFGDFVTKSGRQTPFFVNTGFYRTGAQLRKLGQYYAEAINKTFGLDFDVLLDQHIREFRFPLLQLLQLVKNITKTFAIAQTEKK